MLGAVVIQTQSADNYYRYGQRKRYPIPDSGNGFSKAPIKVTDSRQLREFSIKGHKVWHSLRRMLLPDSNIRKRYEYRRNKGIGN